jgi:hypothetical protein
MSTRTGRTYQQTDSPSRRAQSVTSQRDVVQNGHDYEAAPLRGHTPGAPAMGNVIPEYITLPPSKNGVEVHDGAPGEASHRESFDTTPESSGEARALPSNEEEASNARLRTEKPMYIDYPTNSKSWVDLSGYITPPHILSSPHHKSQSI